MVWKILKMNQRYCSSWWWLWLPSNHDSILVVFLTVCTGNVCVPEALNACWDCREKVVYWWNQGQIQEWAQTCWWRMEDGEQLLVTPQSFWSAELERLTDDGQWFSENQADGLQAESFVQHLLGCLAKQIPSCGKQSGAVGWLPGRTAASWAAEDSC